MMTMRMAVVMKMITMRMAVVMKTMIMIMVVCPLRPSTTGMGPENDVRFMDLLSP